MGSPSEFLKEYLDLQGPAYTISCACSSGAKALAAAKRLLENDLCDAVIAGGVDTICELTLRGFNSLELIDDKLCLPFSKNRQGLNIGEGGAFFLLTREKSKLQLCGSGESSDAYHHSSPQPEGKGAISAMQNALKDAELSASDIDYINLHGTGTKQNDAMEATAVNHIFGEKTYCSSTKPLTGHTLGAAGAIEAAFCCMTLTEQTSPYHHWDGESDPELALLNFSNPSKPRYALSNSFAFGGNNCSLIFGVDND